MLLLLLLQFVVAVAVVAAAVDVIVGVTTFGTVPVGKWVVLYVGIGAVALVVS